MKTIDIKVEGMDSPVTCDLVQKQIMTQQGVVDVVVEPSSQLVHIKLEDSCSCNKDDVFCLIKDIGLGVSP